MDDNGKKPDERENINQSNKNGPVEDDEKYLKNSGNSGEDGKTEKTREMSSETPNSNKTHPDNREKQTDNISPPPDDRREKREKLKELKELDSDGVLDEEGILEEEIDSQKEIIEKEKEAENVDILSSLEGKTVYRVKVVHSNATEFCICVPELEVKEGDYVIVTTRYGRDLGRVQGILTNLLEIGTNQVITLQKKATEKDLKLFEDNKEKDNKAFAICKEKIEQHGLEMKLVSAHYLLDEPKILFFFTAEARVDFRELVKDLVAVFKTRIELRQIGVRDESRLLGGLGMCGRGFCCNTITDKLQPVSIKMAKEQNLSLNSLKISGACGRLLCCLAYEYPYYKEQKEKLPSIGENITYSNINYAVTDINLFTRKIALKDTNDRTYTIDFDKIKRNSKEERWEIVSLV
jgi:cell fate regulator YaaT (PSP1 superfamily)